jgi:hypothetical protein
MDAKQRERLEAIFRAGPEKALADIYAEFFTPLETLQLAWLEYRFVNGEPAEKEKDFIFLESVKRAFRKTFEKTVLTRRRKDGYGKDDAR